MQQLWADHESVTNNSFIRMLPINETEAATIVRALYSKRQLFERVTNFWHDHFNVFGWDYDCGPVFVHYDRDVIRANALGNFRTMLEAVATSTAMQIFLDNKSSRGADFNENYRTRDDRAAYARRRKLFRADRSIFGAMLESVDSRNRSHLPR